MSEVKNRFDLCSRRFPSESLTKSVREEPCVIGIDEAGRGPVLGPLVYALFVCPVRLETTLRGLGANDSKALCAKTRESFFSRMIDVS
jgi:ribonuclease H2 subunit A